MGIPRLRIWISTLAVLKRQRLLFSLKGVKNPLKSSEP